MKRNKLTKITSALLCLSLAMGLTSCANESKTTTSSSTTSSDSTVQDATSTTAADTSSDTSSDTPDETTEETSKQLTKLEADFFQETSDSNITISNPSYYETDKYILLFDEGITVPSNITSTVELMLEETEKETGLSFFPDKLPEYAKEISPNVSSITDDPSKLVIHLSNIENLDRKAETTPNEVTIFSPYYKTDEYGLSVMEHEITHLNMFRYVYPESLILIEGVAEFYGDRVCRRIEGYPICYESYEYGTGRIREEISPLTTLDYFMSDLLNSQNKKAPYQYGTSFVTFIYETCGEQWLDTFISSAYRDSTISKDDVVSILQSEFGQDLFEKFAAWYKTNSERFKYKDITSDDLVLSTELK